MAHKNDKHGGFSANELSIAPVPLVAGSAVGGLGWAWLGLIHVGGGKSEATGYADSKTNTQTFHLTRLCDFDLAQLRCYAELLLTIRVLPKASTRPICSPTLTGAACGGAPHLHLLPLGIESGISEQITDLPSMYSKPSQKACNLPLHLLARPRSVSESSWLSRFALHCSQMLSCDSSTVDASCPYCRRSRSFAYEGVLSLVVFAEATVQERDSHAVTA